MADKVKSMAEVIRAIPDGAHVALGGFAIARNVIDDVIMKTLREANGPAGTVLAR